jgi:hypothetical protein
LIEKVGFEAYNARRTAVKPLVKVTLFGKQSHNSTVPRPFASHDFVKINLDNHDHFTS